MHACMQAHTETHSDRRTDGMLRRMQACTHLRFAHVKRAYEGRIIVQADQNFRYSRVHNCTF